MSIARQLVETQTATFDLYTDHPFVQGIGSGDLDREKFKYYMIQDYLYLTDYARVFALGAAKAKKEEAMKIFSAYVSLIMAGEMEIHRGYMARLGISLEEAENAQAHLDNISYTSYMIRIAYEEGAAEVAAAILSCAVSYEIIARNLLRQYPDADKHPFYGEWVQGYSCEEYHEGNIELMNLLDELAKGYTPEQIDRLTEIFRITTEYEGAFWDMAWNYEGA